MSVPAHALSRAVAGRAEQDALTRSVTDSEADVTIEPQTVRDVDVYYASL